MHMLPYKALSAFLPAAEREEVTIPISFLRFLLSAAAQSAEFDEEDYLRKNPDVAIAVRQGKWGSGKDHYAASGYFEGRAGAGMPLSESWYLRANPDVARAVKEGEWPSAREHYNMRGMFEWRIPSREAAEDIEKWKQSLGTHQDDHAAAEDPAEAPAAQEGELQMSET